MELRQGWTASSREKEKSDRVGCTTKSEKYRRKNGLGKMRKIKPVLNITSTKKGNENKSTLN